MKLQEIRELLGAAVISKNWTGDLEIGKAYCADLMSDVLAFSLTHSLLITHLTNTQVIRTSVIADIKAIVFVQGKHPDPATLAFADLKGIPLLVTEGSMFETCGKLYEKGLRSEPAKILA